MRNDVCRQKVPSGGDSLCSRGIHEKQGMKSHKYLQTFHLPGCPNISSHCSVCGVTTKNSFCGSC